jgi:serine/threonine protein kinase
MSARRSLAATSGTLRIVAASQALGSPSDVLLEPYEILRPIGSPAGSTFLARYAPKGGKAQLVILERHAGIATSADPAAVQFVREAKRITTLIHSNLPRVREVLTRGDDMIVVGTFVEGEKLSELWHVGDAGRTKLTLEAILRVLIDVLGGLGALHSLSDNKQPPLRIIHGEVSPLRILVGLDGASRLLGAVARRAPGTPVDPASARYVAPEILAGGAADARADVYSVGVLLWEALSGKPLMSDIDPVAAAIIERVQAKLPPASVPDKSPWAKPLADVIARALQAKPEDRFPTATALAGEIRSVAGAKLAPMSATSEQVRSAAGERIKARRVALEGEATAGASPASLTLATPPPGQLRPLAPPLPQQAKAAVTPPSPPTPPPAVQAIAALLSSSAPAPPPAAPPIVPEPVELEAPEPEPPSILPALDAAPMSQSLPSKVPTLRPIVAVPPAKETAGDGVGALPVAEPTAPFPLVSHAAAQIAEPFLPPPSAEDLGDLPGVMLQPEPPESLGLPSARPPMSTAPSIILRRTRRRRFVLGSVALLGLVMLGLVGFQLLRLRRPDILRSVFPALAPPAHPTATAVAVPPMPTPAVTPDVSAAPPPSASAPAAPPASATPTASAVVSASASAPAALVVPPTPPLAKPPPPKPPVVVKPKPPPPAAPPRKPTTKQTFHPSGL